MNSLQIFKNEQFGAIRTVRQNGEILFVATDICKALEIKDTSKAVARLDADEKGTTLIRTPGGEQNLLVVNEYGLYNLVLASRKPEAKAFKRWITHDVIPSIRKTGGYINGSEDMSDDEIMARALLMAQKTIENNKERISQLESDNNRMRPKEIFADAVSASDSTILIGDMAKLIKQNGHAIGQKRLFEWMRENGYLIKRKGADYNSPTQRAMEMGLFRIKETAITHSDGHVSVSKTVKVTGKGQQYFNKFEAMKRMVEAVQNQTEEEFVKGGNL